jgi:hypothetical protein
MSAISTDPAADTEEAANPKPAGPADTGGGGAGAGGAAAAAAAGGGGGGGGGEPRSYLIQTLTKCRGQNGKPPPPLDRLSCVFVFGSVLLSFRDTSLPASRARGKRRRGGGGGRGGWSGRGGGGADGGAGGGGGRGRGRGRGGGDDGGGGGRGRGRGEALFAIKNARFAIENARFAIENAHVRTWRPSHPDISSNCLFHVF